MFHLCKETKTNEHCTVARTASLGTSEGRASRQALPKLSEHRMYDHRVPDSWL